MKQPISHLQDPDMQKVPEALMRAARRAKKLAEQSGTEFVVVRDGQLVREIPQSPETAKRSSESSGS